MMSHRQAVLLMVLVTLLWSMAGVVTRQVEQAQGLTLTFWRSAFNNQPESRAFLQQVQGVL
ncbi:MAG: hypothetical protein EBT96_11065, partial [Betaproteobacteria bacterium]|nr:hypothetical protein [Betaproteobacteria bacterium]